MEKKDKILMTMGLIAFVAYNVIVFAIAGFKNHGVVFWETYFFGVLSFVIVAVSSSVSGLKRDWLFGYSVFLHNNIYILVELVAAAFFMVLDKSIDWKIPFTVQFIILCVHLFFVASAFYVKESAQDVRGKIRIKTQYIRLLQVDVETIQERCKEEDIKIELKKFAEELRFSDPMSNDLLMELEQKLSLIVEQMAQAVKEERSEEALILCQEARQLLVERNRKCKVLK